MSGMFYLFISKYGTMLGLLIVVMSPYQACREMQTARSTYSAKGKEQKKHATPTYVSSPSPSCLQRWGMCWSEPQEMGTGPALDLCGIWKGLHFFGPQFPLVEG